MNKDPGQNQIHEFIRRDPYARHLGATIEIIEPGYSQVSLIITEEMTNFHGMAHGGVIFSLGDIAFSAAGNGSGQTAVAQNVAITYLQAAHVGDHLTAVAQEIHAGGRTALYEITISNAETGELIAKSQNLLYRKKEWFI